MPNMIKFAFVQALTLSAVWSFNLGMSWIEEGSGIHPMAAGGLAVVFMLLPYALENSDE